MRAPIFYDSNDTSYYVDPNSTSFTNRMGSYYFQNNVDVSNDHPFGLYFSNGLSTAYAIYREPGAWTWPYPDLRIAFHTGIKIGANAGYQGVRFYDDYGMGTQVMSVNNGSDPLGGNNVYVNNSLQAGSSLRAPIFYDSDNTGYYLDPNSTSNLFRLTLNPGTIGAATGLYVNGGDITAARSSTTGVIFFGTSGSAYLYHDGSSYIFGSIGGYTITDASFRAPIFYDSNNTAYYADFAATGDSIRAAGNIVAYYSDERLKKHLGKIENALDKVDQLEGFYYEANEVAQKLGYKAKREVGVSAQAVQRVLPEIVTDAPIDARYLTIDYERLVPLLIEAIKELTVEVKTLKSKVH